LIAVDTNVLVYAHRRETSEHRHAFAWLKFLSEGISPWGIPVFCLGEFIRVVTHARVFEPASKLEIAIEALSHLLESPSLRILATGLDYPALYFNALRAADARGNLAFDAQIAAVCAGHGVTKILTYDRDFARFRNLEIISIATSPG
jgi:uncharacterized protein